MDEDSDGFGDAGETVNYTATFQNTGNVRVEDVSVSHSLEEATLLCVQSPEAVTSPSNVRKSANRKFTKEWFVYQIEKVTM